MFWIVGEDSPYRSAALLACLVYTFKSGRTVHDAGRDLPLLAEAVALPVVSENSAVISVDLETAEAQPSWRSLSRALERLRRSNQPIDEPYPLLAVAGTTRQEKDARDALGALVEVDEVTPRGLPHNQEIIFDDANGVAASILSGEHIFNRGLPATAHALFGRDLEKLMLSRAWESNAAKILSVIGYGGTGKSALISSWLSDMQNQGYEGATRVFTWSFYSQGTRENLVSADPFVNSALAWLGEDSSKYPNPWAKGKQLAAAIKRHKFLLILDGVEPLQQPLTVPDVGGQLTDDSMRALLEDLAEPDWLGLCIVTSRVPLTDIRRFEKPDGTGTVQTWDLDNLDDEAGAALLRHIIGRPTPFRELQQAIQEVDGHALSISLLGNYLRDVHDGDIAGRYDLEKLTVEVRQGGHARRIVASYSRWLTDHDRKAELALLQIIGLFDRPATPKAMEALLATRS